MASSTILDCLETHAAQRPDKPALVFLSGDEQTVSFSYAELITPVKALAAYLKPRAASGDRAVLAYSFEPEYLIAFFACLYACIIAVPGFPPKPNRKLDRLSGMFASARPRFFLSTQAVLKKMHAQGQTDAQSGASVCLATDAIADLPADQLISGPRDPSGIAFLQYTSGSTTAPRGVAISHANLLANIEMCASAIKLSAQTPLVGCHSQNCLSRIFTLIA